MCPPGITIAASVNDLAPATDQFRAIAGRRVCVGAAGSTTGWGVVRSLLARWPDVAVVAADTNPRELVAAAAIADGFLRVPTAEGPGYVEAMGAALHEHAIDTYIPIHDLDLIAAAGAAAEGAWPGVTVVGPSLAAAELCWDKLATAGALAAAGVRAPMTMSAADADASDGGPWMLKPRRGVGSVGVRPLDDLGGLAESERTPDVIVQERCLLPEVTIDAFASRGQAVTLCRDRVEVKAGVCTKARLFLDDELTRLATATASACRLRGTFCMQVMRDARDSWSVTDVNPRPGGATAMSVAVGMDFHSAMLAAAWGVDTAPCFVPPDGDRWVARGYAEYIL
jgi:carbamoylphosphate synthase large subunit